MDYNLYIILPEKDLKQVGISEVKISWGEEIFSYDPRRFMFEDKVQMIFSKCRIHEAVDENEMPLRIMDGLHELEWDVNKERENLKSNNIIRMLQKICQLDKFSICFFEDDEIIERQIEYTNERNIVQLVVDVLNWESPQNIEIYKL